MLARFARMAVDKPFRHFMQKPSTRGMVLEKFEVPEEHGNYGCLRWGETDY